VGLSPYWQIIILDGTSRAQRCAVGHDRSGQTRSVLDVRSRSGLPPPSRPGTSSPQVAEVPETEVTNGTSRKRGFPRPILVISTQRRVPHSEPCTNGGGS